MRKISVYIIKQKGYKSEDQHALSLKAYTRNKKVKAHDKHLIDIQWLCNIMRVYDKLAHSLDGEK